MESKKYKRKTKDIQEIRDAIKEVERRSLQDSIDGVVLSRGFRNGMLQALKELRVLLLLLN